MSVLLRCIVFVIMIMALIGIGYVKGSDHCVILKGKQEQVDLHVESKIDEKVSPLTDPAVDKLLQRWTRK